MLRPALKERKVVVRVRMTCKFSMLIVSAHNDFEF